MSNSRHSWCSVIGRDCAGHGWRSGYGAAESAVAIAKASVTIAETAVAYTAITKAGAGQTGVAGAGVPGVAVAVTQGVATVATQSSGIASIAVSESGIPEQGATDIASSSAGDQGQE